MCFLVGLCFLCCVFFVVFFLRRLFFVSSFKYFIWCALFVFPSLQGSSMGKGKAFEGFFLEHWAASLTSWCLLGQADLENFSWARASCYQPWGVIPVKRQACPGVTRHVLWSLQHFHLIFSPTTTQVWLSRSHLAPKRHPKMGIPGVKTVSLGFY